MQGHAMPAVVRSPDQIGERYERNNENAKDRRAV